jgi:glycosyltransferase involved in cell wall biosynthesis
MPMKIAILYSPWCLSFRGDLSPDRDDPRGLSGSEQACIRLAQELSEEHEVTVYTVATFINWGPIRVHKWENRGDEQYDLAISINYPDELRDVKADKRVCYQLVNDFTYCQPGFEGHVDLWLSPSEPHRQMVVSGKWLNAVGERVGTDETWKVVPLGCDPERYDGHEKIPGRVVYCSSPDRGLHWLLQEWPAIKRAVPHATLHIFYRLQAWIDGFANTAYYPAIEGLRQRALYIQEALWRMRGEEWGITVRDSVSRATIEREMGMAEVLAYPCDTTSWSEGFSCTILEACAAMACPVITDCDALGEIYESAGILVAPRADLGKWRRWVIGALDDERIRHQTNILARDFAERHTWKLTAQKLLEAVTS